MRGQAVGAFLASVLAASCSYTPSVTHPRMPEPSAAEAEFSCEQVDLAIDRADTVRWVIRDDGGKLETGREQAGRYAANTVLVPLSFWFLWTFIGIPDGGHAVLDSVDMRMLGLLQLKRNRSCPARATAHPGVDDLTLTGQLEALQARIEGPEGRTRPLLDERTRLLDGARVVPPAPGDDLQAD